MVANLKQLRKEHGFSQQALAEMLGITQQAVYKYENLTVEPDIQTLVMMADLFGVSVDYLIGHSEKRSDCLTAQVILTKDELKHLTLWRMLPLQFRREFDALMNKYEIRPSKRVVSFEEVQE